MNKVKSFISVAENRYIEREVNSWLEQNDGKINPISITLTKKDDNLVIVNILYELLEQE